MNYVPHPKTEHASKTCQINLPSSLQLEIEQTKQNATKPVAFSIWAGFSSP
jgi:hypothetical protein